MNTRIFILADDLTGAAELGGIARQFGMTVRILFDPDKVKFHKEDVIIIDSDTRSLNPDHAYSTITEIMSAIDFTDFSVIYKKVDSILRGPIVSEISAMLNVINFNSAVLIPANPSKNRIIRSGVYYIDEIPLNQTNFRSDPEYPRYSEYVRDLIIDSSDNIVTGNDLDTLDQGGIIIPDITSEEELESFVLKLPQEGILYSGAADFFSKILSSKIKLHRQKIVSRLLLQNSPCFIIGSYSDSSKKTIRSLEERNYVLFQLPVAAIDNEDKFTEWIQKIIKIIDQNRIVISGPSVRIENSEEIIKIRNRLVNIAKVIVKKIPARSQLFIEGGGTASQFFRLMGWNDFKIGQVFGPGVVSVIPGFNEINIIVKPGSYQWPDRLIYS